MDVNTRDKGVFAFGTFRLDPVRRVLLREGEAVRLSARLFDTLLYLVQNHDRLVEHAELEQAVWRGRTVEEGNVAKAVSSLRKALQADDAAANFIATVAGRGYRFAAPVAFEPEPTGSVTGVPVDWTEPAPSGAVGAESADQPWWWRRRATFGVAALGLVVVTSAAAIWGLRPASETVPQAAPAPIAAAPFSPPPHSVAVMAFTNLSGDPSQDYFSDGLSEELIDALGRTGTLRVPARLSSFSFKGKQVPVGDIARQLNVGAVVEGSVRRDGPRLRVTAQLIDATTGYQIWSNHYDRDQGDVIKVQTDIAGAVAAALQVTFAGDDATKFSVGGTTNPKAFDAYLRGMKFHTERTPDAVRQARAAFDEALALDPGFALAHVRRASCLILISEGAAERQPGDGDDRALLAAALAEGQRAIALAPSLGPAHAIVANALFLSWNIAPAQAEYARARELAPGDAWVNEVYGNYQALIGHSALAAAAAERGTILDPLSTEAYLIAAQINILARRPDSAVAALRRAEQLGYSGSQDLWVNSLADLEKGDAAAAQRACANSHDDPSTECLAIADFMLGRRNDAEAELMKLRAANGDRGALAYACIYAQWGRTEDALNWLERAYARHVGELITIRSVWLFDPIRDEPRFKDIEKRMNFPQL
jgi:TolB-like protein/DNA-binding winged helix-turn-helix (wHTH) protein